MNQVVPYILLVVALLRPTRFSDAHPTFAILESPPATAFTVTGDQLSLLVERDIYSPPLIRRQRDRLMKKWERFETEFAIHPNDKAPVRHQIALVKYGMDTATFSVSTFLEEVSNTLDFELRDGHWQRTELRLPPRRDAASDLFGDPRVKVDAALVGSRPYLGLRLIIPFGS